MAKKTLSDMVRNEAAIAASDNAKHNFDVATESSKFEIGSTVYYIHIKEYQYTHPRFRVTLKKTVSPCRILNIGKQTLTVMRPTGKILTRPQYQFSIERVEEESDSIYDAEALKRMSGAKTVREAQARIRACEKTIPHGYSMLIKPTKAQLIAAGFKE